MNEQVPEIRDKILNIFIPNFKKEILRIKNELKTK
jgi:hypothetical protein